MSQDRHRARLNGGGTAHSASIDARDRSTPAYLRAAGTSLLLDWRGDALPRILHWGRDLGDLGPAELQAVVKALEPPVMSNAMDEPVPLAVVPEASAGWAGTPGVQVHRDGRAFSTAFVISTMTVREKDEVATVDLVAQDPDAQVGLTLVIELLPSGVLRQKAAVTNLGGGTLDVQDVNLSFPVPQWAGEVLDLTGRHLRERSPQRHPLTMGTHLRENRRGRTGTDASTVLVVGEPGFGFDAGQVWGIHVAWSGNHQVLAEALPSGARLLAGGELLLPGEIRLESGERYETPYLYAAHAEGLDSLATRFHSYLRSRPSHPTTSRPVTLNTWEAVYFDHDLLRLQALADKAAEVGVERFVLDDGWFKGRDSDRVGLGDWVVDPIRWPDGLHPLVDYVTGRGMQFGLWVEPEMVNPDSNLARAHPDWILAPEGRKPPLSRHQQVLNLGRPEAFSYLLGCLDALLDEYHIGYLKWDHNRDLVDAGDAWGSAGVHAQTQATYALMDTVRRHHPQIEIESCSSGGGRVDLGVLERTDRVWASDCIDPLERQQIQRWTGQLLPPELIGSHVGSPRSHSTGRHHSLDFRAATAFFGHFGIEWDLTQADQDELDRLSAWVAAYQQLRGLLHSGRVVRAEHPDPALWVHGVVAQDASHAVYALVQMATSVHAPPGPVRLPGLSANTRYAIHPLPPGDRVVGPGRRPLPWWTAEELIMSGRALTEVGIQAPILFPEAAVLLECRRLD